MKEQLLSIKEKALVEIESIQDDDALESFRIAYMGKKGHITSMMKRLGELPPQERPLIGQLANQIKKELSEALEELRNKIAGTAADDKSFFDVTLPGREPVRGHIHPINQVNQEICDILSKMGFKIVKGPNIELDYYNFEALNLPKDHPDNTVLRTHTSPMQIRVMEPQEPPVCIIAPGKVYRCDSDVSHTPMFHQVEGLLVDKGVTFGDLKGTLTGFLHQMFGSDTMLRFRPSFFPFTEPSAEVDIQCVLCRGKGCRTCSQSGWLEILGSGMVDPAVYGFVNYDPETVSGFAFGMGIERIAMLKYQINDIRYLFENDIRFLKQFS